MKAVVQRVTHASVTVDGEIKGQIGQGFLILLGVGQNDTEEDADRLVNKIVKLRIFSDENDKINLSLADVGGSLLVISQFTLYADCRKGNRPNFIQAGKPDEAERLYEYFVSQCKKQVPVVEKGVFGADMKVELLNDGPFTVVLEDI
ncbi:MAG: D-aminoacyl-tRNA deacylase [Oscillospiraceae bacterium]|nr:D-aminoacyl-tRNA deacylase [Oscillospiraceae bacterium]